jgi:predicted nucleotidyltransferase
MSLHAVTWSVREGRAVWGGRLLREWVDDLVAEIVAEFDPVEVWLFGSVACGDDTGDSDIDLLIVLDVYSPDKAIELKMRASRTVTVPPPFDAVFTNVERMTSRSRIVGTMERAAATHGRRVFRRD